MTAEMHCNDGQPIGDHTPFDTRLVPERTARLRSASSRRPPTYRYNRLAAVVRALRADNVIGSDDMNGLERHASRPVASRQFAAIAASDGRLFTPRCVRPCNGNHSAMTFATRPF